MRECRMPGAKLDPIDRKILAELQADGRMTNVELSRRVGISAPPCLRRVRALEEAGLIRGYHADVNARELGFEVQVFAMVGLTSQAEADLVGLRGEVPRLAAGARMPHAERRDRLHPEMRRAGPVDLPELPDRAADLGAERRQRQDQPGDPLRQGRAGGALRRLRGPRASAETDEAAADYFNEQRAASSHG